MAKIKPGDTVIHAGVEATVEQVVTSRHSAFIRSERHVGWVSLDSLAAKTEGKIWLGVTRDEAQALLKELEGRQIDAVEWMWALNVRTQLQKILYG